MTEAQIRSAIVEVGRRLYARGLVAATEGNISVRDGGVFFVTPAGTCKGFLAPGAIVKMDLDGRPLARGRASTETRMHAAVYRCRPDVGAVVHAHPPAATGFAVAQIPLDAPLIAEAVVVLGTVPLVPYATPTTTELAEGVGRAIVDAQALLLSNHGALTVGATLIQAWERMETLEQTARIALAARLLGRERALPAAEVARLFSLRSAALDSRAAAVQSHASNSRGRPRSTRPGRQHG